MNEIFGEDNFIGVFSVNSTPNARDYGHIGKMHEYVVLYAKSIADAESFLLPDVGKSFKYSDIRGAFNIHPLYNSNVAFTSANRPNLFYPFYLNSNVVDADGFCEISLTEKADWLEVWPPKSQKESAQFVWRWGKEKSTKNLNSEIIGYRTAAGEFRIVQKMRHSAKLIRSLLVDKSFSTRRGTAEVEELFGKKLFSFPKPQALMRTLVEAFSGIDDVVLDLFAGSNSLGQAVLELNAEQSVNRKLLAIQLPEGIDNNSLAFEEGFTTVSTLAIERLKLVVKRLAKKSELFESEEVGFRVFHLNSSNFIRWDGTFDKETSSDKIQKQLDLSVNNVVENSDDDAIVFELLLKAGFPLTTKVVNIDTEVGRLLSIEEEALIICLEGKITQELLDEVVKLEPIQFICLDKAFQGNDQLKANAVQTFSAHNHGRDKADQIIFRTV